MAESPILGFGSDRVFGLAQWNVCSQALVCNAEEHRGVIRRGGVVCGHTRDHRLSRPIAGPNTAKLSSPLPLRSPRFRRLSSCFSFLLLGLQAHSLEEGRQPQVRPSPTFLPFSLLVSRSRAARVTSFSLHSELFGWRCMPRRSCDFDRRALRSRPLGRLAPARLQDEADRLASAFSSSFSCLRICFSPLGCLCIAQCSLSDRLHTSWSFPVVSMSASPCRLWHVRLPALLVVDIVTGRWDLTNVNAGSDNFSRHLYATPLLLPLLPLCDIMWFVPVDFRLHLFGASRIVTTPVKPMPHERHMLQLVLR